MNRELYTAEELAADWQEDGQIKWWNVPMEHGSVFDINDIMDALAAAGYKKAKVPKGQKNITSIAKLRNKYYYYKLDNSFTMCWVEEKVGYGECYYRAHKVSTMSNSPFDSGSITGYQAYKEVVRMFASMTDKNFSRQFGGALEHAKLIKRCVCPPVCYPANEGTAQKYDKVYKADVSSAYPYEGSKSLPTLKDAKVVNGKVEPTEEYPFAFYVKGGGLKIWGEFATWDWYRFADKFYTPWEKGHFVVKEEQTILCKKAEYDLRQVFETMYGLRKEKPEYKSFMNLFIGYCHRNNNPAFSHIAAVVLARCVNRILTLAEELENRGNQVILIATDAVAWTGKAEDDLYTRPEDKQLGSLVIEYEDIEACIKGSKCYQLKNKEGKIATFWSGIPKSLTKELDFGEIITAPHKPEQVIWNETLQRFVGANNINQPLQREEYI